MAEAAHGRLAILPGLSYVVFNALSPLALPASYRTSLGSSRPIIIDSVKKGILYFGYRSGVGVASPKLFL